MKVSLLLCCLAGVAASAATPVPSKLVDAYGICAHVSRNEIEYVDKTFQRMNEAGILWARTDYDWHRVEVAPGKWSFDHLDSLHAIAKKYNVRILPILGYNTKWATPAWKHLDEWCEFVRQLVVRYQNDLPVWEIWNEENLSGFWKDEPNGARYAELLKRTYETIKSVNPNLVVLYGGTAGVPLGYFEESFKAGALDGCDAIAIHPYNWSGVPEDMLNQFAGLRQLLAKYNAPDKPLWITEVGWSTAQVSDESMKPFVQAFRYLGIKEKACPLAVAVSEDYVIGTSSTLRLGGYVEYFDGKRDVQLDDIGSLDPKEYPVLLPCIGENFPISTYLPALKAYLNKGGTLLLPSGLPFYYDLLPGGKRRQVDSQYMAPLHMGWEAWWTKKGVPTMDTWREAAGDFKGKFTTEKLKASGRFFNDDNLKGGDKLIPLVAAGAGDYRSQIACIYQFDSDLKGNVIVGSFMGLSESVPEDIQARHLPRTYLLSFASRIEKVLWYNLRAAEWDMSEREACFGIVHKDLSPKPAFETYKVMTSMCPDGSTYPEMTRDDKRFVLGWTRPDGVKTWAVWNMSVRETVELEYEGKVTRCIDDYGKPYSFEQGRLALSPSIVYIEGPTSLRIKK